ncbi:hypothetical protein [Fodinibius halophilus]|uniref:Uncharacterized protein n=1 Tax=Fodinibius halophilus TaxID=1736908 RepID=A0A6M1T1L6_9BACT|nr:hypothetical protein [Fodinibius halophilus]NGP87075.1 hypothetical protein [Fodinibius halophilus]
MAGYRNNQFRNHKNRKSRNYKWIHSTLVLLFAAIMIVGCKDSATGDDGSKKEVKTYDLALSGDGSKIGTVSTSVITEDDDAYIDEGFFVTINLTTSNFNPPFDIHINNTDGYCGTFDVQEDEQAEMPCDYDNFLSEPSQLTITAEGGDGEEANPLP